MLPHKCNPSRLWSIINSFDGRCAETPPNQPITFSSTSPNRNEEIVTAFAKQFTSAVSHTSRLSTQIFRRKFLKEFPLDSSVRYPASILILFCWLLKTTVILMLLVQLTLIQCLYNLSVNHCNIPVIWKHATIILVPKSGKQADLVLVIASSPSFALLLRS